MVTLASAHACAHIFREELAELTEVPACGVEEWKNCDQAGGPLLINVASPIGYASILPDRRLETRAPRLIVFRRSPPGSRQTVLKREGTDDEATLCLHVGFLVAACFRDPSTANG
jgi:hypothetical protein